MKKAKMMLMAITFLAAVGGALAFKASMFQTNQLFYVTFSQMGTTCITSSHVTSDSQGQSRIPNPAGNFDWYTTEGCSTAVSGYDHPA